MPSMKDAKSAVGLRPITCSSFWFGFLHHFGVQKQETHAGTIRWQLSSLGDDVSVASHASGRSLQTGDLKPKGGKRAARKRAAAEAKAKAAAEAGDGATPSGEETRADPAPQAADPDTATTAPGKPKGGKRAAKKRALLEAKTLLETHDNGDAAKACSSQALVTTEAVANLEHAAQTTVTPVC